MPRTALPTAASTSRFPERQGNSWLGFKWCWTVGSHVFGRGYPGGKNCRKSCESLEAKRNEGGTGTYVNRQEGCRSLISKMNDQPVRRASSTSSSASSSRRARFEESDIPPSCLLFSKWYSSAIFSAASTASRELSTVWVWSATARILPSTYSASFRM